MKKLHIILLLPLFVVSCSQFPIERNGNNTIDRTEKCMLRLVEKNGVSASEAQRVCEDIFRQRYDTIGEPDK